MSKSEPSVDRQTGAPPAPRRASLRRWVVLLATLVGMVVTASMGRWQLGRADQKLALQAALDAQAGRAVVALRASDLADFDEATWMHRQVTVRGRWLADRTVYLDNRPLDGRPGFIVVTPLQVEGRDAAILVQRGWMPRDVSDRLRVAPVATPPGEVELRGRIAPPPSKLYQFSDAESGAIRQNLDLDSFSREIATPLWPVSLVQSESDGDMADGLQRRWPKPAVDVHKHYGYAFQWFAMCALMAGLYVWFQIVQPRLRRAR
jgi:surfeit locus 1 family protein